MTTVSLSSDQLSTVVAKAIMDGMTAETREKLIADAVAGFLKHGVSDRYGSVTHLQSLFNEAVIAIARKMIEEKLMNDAGFIAKIEGALTEATTKAFESECRTKMIEQLAQAIRKGITGRDY